MDDCESLHRYWSQPSPRGGEPELLLKRNERSRALVQLVSDVPHEAAVLEVGCSAGRNLAHLADAGYTNLNGIDINCRAIGLAVTEYPQLANADLRCGPAETLLPEFGNAQFGLVFTMAVIKHLHPDSVAVFDHMARIGDSILAIESWGERSHRSYPHDIESLFEQRGFQVRSKIWMGELVDTEVDRSMASYWAWRFVRTEGLE